jgi:spermidine synthase
MPTTTDSPAVRIREGRDGTELRVSGTLASLYRPGVATTGLVWDALAAPIALLSPARRARILVLGLGGGSAARVARALAPTAAIVGVERSPEVVETARRHFDLDRLGLEVRIEDARAFLSDDGDRYDAVIEDIFAGGTQNVRKPAWLLREGLAQAASRVRPGGVFSSNTIAETVEVRTALRAVWPRLVSIATRDYENRILVGGTTVDAPSLRRAVAAEPLLADVRPRLRFQTV